MLEHYDLGINKQLIETRNYKSETNIKSKLHYKKCGKERNTELLRLKV